MLLGIGMRVTIELKLRNKWYSGAVDGSAGQGRSPLLPVLFGVAHLQHQTSLRLSWGSEWIGNHHGLDSVIVTRIEVGL